MQHDDDDAILDSLGIKSLDDIVLGRGGPFPP